MASAMLVQSFGQSILERHKDAEAKSDRLLSIIAKPPLTDEELNDKIEFQYCPNFEASDNNGLKHELLDYQGQIVILHFWKVHSRNALIDIDFLSAIQSAYQGQLKVLTFSNYDNSEIVPFFNRKGFQTDLTIVPNGFQLPNQLLEEYGICSPQCTIILDADGRFRRIIQAGSSSGTKDYHDKIMMALESSFGA